MRRQMEMGIGCVSIRVQGCPLVFSNLRDYLYDWCYFILSSLLRKDADRLKENKFDSLIRRFWSAKLYHMYIGPKVIGGIITLG